MRTVPSAWMVRRPRMSSPAIRVPPIGCSFSKVVACPPLSPSGAGMLRVSCRTHEFTQTAVVTRAIAHTCIGGGWCYGDDANATMQSCAGRAGFVWPPITADSQPLLELTAPRASDNADIGGIMAQDPRVNPDFHTWNKLFMHYCDGASFGGEALVLNNNNHV